MKQLHVLSVTGFLLLSGCEYLQKGVEEKPLARVGDQYLYRDEVVSGLPPSLSGPDSALYVNEQVNKWVEQTLLVQKAELNLPEEAKDVEQQIQDYRRSLLIYAYEKAFIDQKLDTVISNTEIEAYYEQNLDNFELKDYVVKVIYVKIEKNAPQQEALKTMLQTDQEGEIRYQLEDYCRQFAANYMLEDQAWLYFEDLLKEIPIKSYNIEEFLRNNRYVELEDEQFYYFLVIKDYRLKDSVSPLELEEENIERILLNKRKLNLISEMRKELYQDALSKNQIEYFYR